MGHEATRLLTLVALLAGCAANPEIDLPPDLRDSGSSFEVDAARMPYQGQPIDECADDRDCPGGLVCRQTEAGEFSVRECQPQPEAPSHPGRDAGTSDAMTDASGLAVLDATSSGDGGGLASLDAAVSDDGAPLSTSDASIEGPHDTQLRLVLVVDNSPSMVEERARVARGIEGMVRRLHAENELDLDVFLYTTTAAAESGERAVTQLVETSTWEDGSVHPGLAYPAPGVAFVHDVHRPLAAPQASATFARDITRAALEGALAPLVDAIEDLGVDGSDDEDGLCTIAATAAPLGDESFLDEGDRVAYLVVSDANAASTLCRAKSVTTRDVEERVYTTTTTDPSIAQASRYDGSRFHASAAIETDSGYRDVNGFFFDARDYGVEEACPSAPTDCPAALRAEMTSYVPDGSFRCRFQCLSGYTAGHEIPASVLPPDEDHCASPFTLDGVTYADAYDYGRREGLPIAQGTCRHQMIVQVRGLDWSSAYDNETYYQRLGGRDPAGVANALGERFEAAFVGAIVHQGDAACDASSEGRGDAYLDLVEAMGESGVSQSICDDDYAPTLDALADFLASES